MLETILNGQTYGLATTLRVAYNIQGQHNHKPYAEIFQGIAEMPIEHQIGMIYQSFKVANPEAARSITESEFINYYLDNISLTTMMDQLSAIVEGIVGTPNEDSKAEATAEGN